jgi:hypothetical protein
LIAALALATAGVAVAHAVAQPRALPRATADRPDEVTGPQLHVVYAVPSDGQDRALDTDGTLARSVLAFENWLAAETRGRALRLDTSQGEVDVTFFRLGRTDADIASFGGAVRDQVELELTRAGLVAMNKLYAVYYDGSSTYACGGGAWPPKLLGRVAAMYLKGAYAGVDCSKNPFVPAGGQPGYMEYAMLHEILHTLGHVPECAPNHTRAGHTSAPQNDLMYAGDAPWQFPPQLDPGRDDYYGHGRGGCDDLAASPYLTSWPQQASAPPPPTAPSVATTAPPPKAAPKTKPVPKCKKGQRPTKRKPCRR